MKIMKKMRNYDDSFMSSFSYATKLGIILYLVFIYVFALLGMNYFDTINKVVGSINEWISLYILIIWFFSLTLDWEEIYICLDMETMEWKVIKHVENRL